MKYYFTSYVSRNFGGEWIPGHLVSHLHPFEKIKSWENMPGQQFETVLLNYREITKEEFDLYNKLFDGEIDPD